MASSSVYGSGRTVGRGPSGRVRNMGAMLTPKLMAVERLLSTPEHYDGLALDRARAELTKRGYASSVATSGPPYVPNTAVAMVVTESEVQDEYDELLRWLAEL